MADIIVTSRPNGPFMVQGPVKLQDADGNDINVDSDPIFLCRCGGSTKKPFCDGTHRNNGLKG